MKQKIIYIAGLGHSGSTILDLALGAHSGIIGLGEVYTLLDGERRKKHYTSLCSCGKPATECSFWKDVPQILEEQGTTEILYEKMIGHFRALFGEESILVDSSKNSYGYLKYLNEKHDLKVLFLVRDVRSWSYSRHLQNRKPILLLALQWYLENRKLLFRFRKMGIPFMLIGYEEIALYPEHVMPLISRYLDIPYEPVMLEPDKSKSHIISGNIARVDALKRRRFIYDARWMLSLRINLFSPLLSLLNGWSKKYVYSNISGQNRDEFFLFGTGRRAEMTRKYN